MNRLTLTLIAAALAAAAGAASAADARRPYIVQLADQPAASYTGGLAGLRATKAAPGATLKADAAEVRTYVSYLAQQQSRVLGAVGQPRPIHSYRLVFNGFSARLSEREARALRKVAGVVNITPDVPREPLSNYTPAFLGLDQPDGLWSQLGGRGRAGENIVIGIVDSGVWPENPAFADRVDLSGTPAFGPGTVLAYGPPPALWRGECQSGEGFAAGHCNNKLIGARYFNAGFNASGRALHWTDFVSPRDSVAGPSGHGGHGTHTASTAGGNANVAASVGGVAMGAVSGMAPRARVAVYKVCWTYVDAGNPDGTGSRNACYTSDSVAAIERAVADGVHVINYSISGSQDSVVEPVELAFLGAANAGVFVAASAGNAGEPGSVAHVSPWLTTVAASTHNRFNGASVTTGAGARYTGASLNATPVANAPARAARDAGAVPYAGLNAQDQQARRFCFSAADRAAFGGSAAAALDPARVAGKVLLCERGVSARVDKGRAVAEAGGVGMVLIDNGAGLVSEVHAVPTVHVAPADGEALRAYASATAAPTVSLSRFSIQIGTQQAPVMAGFSSRGPNQSTLNVLKPDLTAPGVDILAGVSPAHTEAERDAIENGTLAPQSAWSFYQGTSMSSPHVAGLAALLRQRHPGWSPAAIKSALMTTAATTYDDGVDGAANGLLPWAQGAGHVVPNHAGDPGLVYDLAAQDYYRFMCGIGATPAAGCRTIGALAPYNLNLPSMTASNVLGRLTLQRSVTNVGAAAASYAASASVPGFTVSVAPATLELEPGQRASFGVTLTRTKAPIGAWSHGALEWRDGVHVVRSPLSARASILAAPASLSSDAASGSLAYTVGTGFTGKLGALKGGLKAAGRDAGSVGRSAAPDGGLAECRAGGSAGVTASGVVVAAGALVARIKLADADTSGHKAAAQDDLDLILLDPAGNVAGYSGGPSANEQITLTAPAAGSYRACVVGFDPLGGTSTYVMSKWLVGGADTGFGFKVALPASVFIGGTASASASWAGLASGAEYLGAVHYLVNGAPEGMTVFEVDTSDALPPAGLGRRNLDPGARAKRRD
ncbi:S8 family peptidase [Massilia glaciei]|uniref:Peptidase S8 and S53 subtilisin kexin sedolisin n=1 Tax=Massilia glaciei TaxID=1524097 RepID=A0A2U2HC45_9BURK|nr:S8 family peptidase [Massilia glaciei]PWF40446.1 peptidase S8 and S53 subtilisin kexin sedolisin [Massilia glaciei]